MQLQGSRVGEAPSETGDIAEAAVAAAAARESREDWGGGGGMGARRLPSEPPAILVLGLLDTGVSPSFLSSSPPERQLAHSQYMWQREGWP